MEASRFGFDPGTPAVLKFDPTDAEIVAQYLVPLALGLPNPNSHVILEDDPDSLPPKELLEKHGHGDSHHAFFLCPPTDKSKNGGRRDRSVRGGVGGSWSGEKGIVTPLTLLRDDGGGELYVEYKKYNLTYRVDGDEDEDEDGDDDGDGKKGKGKAAGWVMHEYQLVHPPLSATVISRIKLTDRKLKEEEYLNEQSAEDQHDYQMSYHMGEPGPSYQMEYRPGPSYQMGEPGPSYQMGDPGPSYQMGYQPGPSYHDPNDPAMSGTGGEGFSAGQQADAGYYYVAGNGTNDAYYYYYGDNGGAGQSTTTDHHAPYYVGDDDYEYDAGGGGMGSSYYYADSSCYAGEGVAGGDGINSYDNTIITSLDDHGHGFSLQGGDLEGSTLTDSFLNTEQAE